MTIKELIKAELDYVSEKDLQEFYQLLKSRSQRQKPEEIDEWDLIIQECQIDTGISDLAYQHHHYIHGTPKIEVE
ncbi:hypothetical protein ACN4EE_05605 [Geminocystis sp. CENA526]|uniref:hypothetical protein n=1 Tax=Geminocystis sp. CENA526 TaxID=1355871 RepID=UPI003D6FBBBF